MPREAKLSKIRTHYDNLQVTRGASSEVIRAAYKSLSQRWHPDRNPQDKRQHCTQVMVVINRAYEILSDPDLRREHDDWIERQERAGSAPKPTPKSTVAVTDADLKSVSVELGLVPSEVRHELGIALKSTKPGYKSAATSSAWSAVLGALLAVGGLVAVFFVAADSHWQGSDHFWAFGVGFLLIWWAASGGLLLIKLKNEPLSHRIFLTPTHVAETDGDILRAWPLLGTKSFAMTVRTKNGSHTSSEVDFRHICGTSTTFTMLDRSDAESLHATCVAVLQTLAQNMDGHLRLLVESPLFELRKRLFQANPASRFHRSKQVAKVASISALVAVAFHWAVILPVNSKATVFRGSPPQRVVEQERAVVEPSRPPAVSPRPTLPKPSTGWIRFPTRKQIAPLQIHADDSTSYFVKLTTVGGVTIGTMFIRAGETLNVDVPLGSFLLRYAYGSSWYGPDELFGEETRYSELDKIMSFSVADNRVSGVEITLTKVAHGNLRDHRLAASDF